MRKWYNILTRESEYLLCQWQPYKIKVKNKKVFGNKKFLEELIAYFPITLIWVSDTISGRKKTTICMWNEVNKTIQFGRLQCWYNWWVGFLKYTVEMSSVGVMYAPSLMTIGLEIRVILRILPQQYERLYVVLVLLRWGIYKIQRSDGTKWHHMRTKFHKKWFGHTGNIKVTTSAIWEAAVLVLLMGGVYDVRRWNGLRRHDIYTKFHENPFRQLSNIAVVIATIFENIIIEGIYELCHWDGFMLHDMRTKFHEDWYSCSSNIKVCFRNLKGCNVCITGGRYLWSAPLRWSQIHIKYYKDWFNKFKI
jgi:hypothetical protein